MNQKTEDNVEEVFKEFSIQEGYLRLASYYEKEFLEDMERLGVRPPNALVRVSEYVDEIIKYIEKIIENGFAYVEDGDVFFDIEMFKSKGFDYGKTSPHDENEVKALLDEGEGALSSHKIKKRNPNDFALWKKSKVLYLFLFLLLLLLLLSMYMLFILPEYFILHHHHHHHHAHHAHHHIIIIIIIIIIAIIIISHQS
jgi:hypothetical protein